MDLKSLLIKEHSPSFNSKTSRSRADNYFHFPTIDKCKSIEKLSLNFSKKALEKTSGKPKTLLVKQAMIEILSGIKDSTEKGLRIKLAFKALECLAKDSGVLNKELLIITKELFDGLYCEKNKVNAEIKSYIYEQYDFIACEQDNTMPLFLILEYWQIAYASIQNAQNHLKHELKILKEELDFKVEEIKYLKSEMANFKEAKEDSTKETIQETVTKGFFPREKYEKQLSELNNIIDDLYSQLHHKEDIIKGHEDNFKHKLCQFKSLEERKKKYSERLKIYKAEVKGLKELNEKLKGKIEKLESEKNKVENERVNDKLDYTCRPEFDNCGNLFEQCLDFSTKGRFRFLISLVSTIKLKKIKKSSVRGLKKKNFTGLSTPFRKQQSYIIGN